MGRYALLVKENSAGHHLGGFLHDIKIEGEGGDIGSFFFKFQGEGVEIEENGIRRLALK